MAVVRFLRDDCPEELFRFRYSVYVEEMDRVQRYADHEAKTIIDPLDEIARQAAAFVPAENSVDASGQGRKAEKIVGCLRANDVRDCDIGEYEQFYDIDKLSAEERDKVMICTRLMVAERYRRTTLPLKLMVAHYEDALDHKISTAFLDCNDHLQGFFGKFGFKHLGRKMHPEYGDVHIMRLDLEDAEHLEKIRSPYWPYLRRRLERARKGLAAE